jgi:hypothetical protein
MMTFRTGYIGRLAIVVLALLYAGVGGIARADDAAAADELLGRLRSAEELLGRSSYTSESVLERSGQSAVRDEEQVTTVWPRFLGRTLRTTGGGDPKRIAIYRAGSSAGMWHSGSAYAEQVVFTNGVVEDDALKVMMMVGGGRRLALLAYGAG